MKKFISISIIVLAALSATPAMAQSYDDNYYRQAREAQRHVPSNSRQVVYAQRADPVMSARDKCNALYNPAYPDSIRAQQNCLRSLDHATSQHARLVKEQYRTGGRLAERAMREQTHRRGQTGDLLEVLGKGTFRILDKRTARRLPRRSN